MWLKEAGGGRAAFFPDARNERFDFTSDVGLFVTRFAVEGTACRPGVSQPGPSSGRVMSTVPNRPLQIFSSKKGPSTSLSSVNVKLIRAMVKKGAGHRLEFKPLHQEYVTVNETTANVYHLLRKNGK